MLNGQYVGCTTGFSQSDKTDVLIPNQQITADNTPYLQRLVAVGLIKLEEQVNESIAPASLASHQPVVEPEPTNGYWLATSRTDAYEKAGEIIQQMPHDQFLSITLATADGTKQISQAISVAALIDIMFGYRGGLNPNSFSLHSLPEMGQVIFAFGFVNENGMPTNHNDLGVGGKPYPDGVGFVSPMVRSENKFQIVATGADNDLATIFGLEQPKFIAHAGVATWAD